MAGVHGLKHVEGLGPADLADDDAVGTHAQGVADEHPGGHLTLAKGVREPRLQSDHMSLA